MQTVSKTMRALIRLIAIVLAVAIFRVPPAAAGEGARILISLADRTLYLMDGAATVASFPVAVGRPGVAVPFGDSAVVRKRRDPVWRPTANQRRTRPGLPDAVPPGPANPLGAFALDLGWPAYAIHGTNEPKSIGRRATSGCFRLSAADIAALFERVAVGTPVRVVSESLKTPVVREASARIPRPSPPLRAVPAAAKAQPPAQPMPEPLPDPRCKVSTAPIRRLICHTPELARLDGTIRALEAAHLAKLPSSQHLATLVQFKEQARWFEEALVTRCWIRRDADSDPATAERAVACLHDSLSSRLADTRARLQPEAKLAAGR